MGAFLGAVQMILYIIYKYYKAPKTDDTEKPKTVSDHSINMVKLASNPLSGDLKAPPQIPGGDLEGQIEKEMANQIQA